MSTTDLVEGLVARRRDIARLEADCARRVAELIRRNAHEDLGYLSPLSLLVHRLRVSVGAARGMIRIATAGEHMPHVRAAFEAGEIDLPRVRLLASAREANPGLFSRHERVLVDSVGALSMADASRAVGYWEQQADVAAAEANAQHQRDRRYLCVSPTLAGMVRIDGQLDPEGGQMLLNALASVTDPEQLDPDDHRSPRQRRADAIVGICRDHLASADTPISGGRRPQIVVTASLDALEGRAKAPCELEDTGVISPETARRIACDADVTRVITNQAGMPLDVGRTRRVVTGKIREALNLRDRGCVIDACLSRARYCDAHHVVHWADGGETSLTNMVLLCARHHTLLHEGKIRLPMRD
ncbi:MAG: DUF222 domain-containing protein [Actinomycetota bacterium]